MKSSLDLASVASAKVADMDDPAHKPGRRELMTRRSSTLADASSQSRQ